jgi:hypothetical protein
MKSDHRYLALAQICLCSSRMVRPRGPGRGATSGPGMIGAAREPRKEASQAARETLSATLTPSTDAGGADGERCRGWPAAIAAATRSDGLG